MRRITSQGYLIKIFPFFLGVLIIGCLNLFANPAEVIPDKFERVRTHIQTWISKRGNGTPIMSTSYLKEQILDDWNNQRAKYQIVSVRKSEDYQNAGHIPNAINLYWVDIVKDKSLHRLDFKKEIILYCYYGHGSMICYTVLSLLGYRCYSLDFGMMDWNINALVKKPWDRKTEYEVDTSENGTVKSYDLPKISSTLSSAREIIMEMAKKYFAGEGSPIIRSSDVKAIVDDWEHKRDKFQIIDVRSKKKYKKGHIPHALNIPWINIAEIKNLKRINPDKTIIVCSENGQIGFLAATVLNLLGYQAVDMLFGMMDWNISCVDRSAQWDGLADYPVAFPSDIHFP